MHLLGLCNGSKHGNSEILLKAALRSATRADSSITVSWIHVPSVSIPRNRRPIKIDRDIIPYRNDEHQEGMEDAEFDDREAVYNAIMDADALIIVSPVYSHQPAGSLKALADAILGPFADVSEAYRIKLRQSKGDSVALESKIDPREVKPRVAGFITVAGSGPQFPEQWTMALPTMHSIVYCLHAQVIDQIVLPGFANAGAVLIDSGTAIKRAELLARRVVSQMGKAYDEATYLGSAEEGSCPYCHLLKIEFREGNDVVCIVCGANGVLRTDLKGNIRPIWEAASKVSCLTLEGKWKHLDDIHETLSSEQPKLKYILPALDQWKDLKFPLSDMPNTVI
ncbi:unnamed protein product [Clonostachys rosea]|uniref:NADPH-dependent FMN reductase-like domain-containing protein n=1 Tax=Bionectria ochroleuca TaxID=29856 RepID=A0ABY6UP37_BIOOC|nr:unnamed protein product [Clonostachys rosea]